MSLVPGRAPFRRVAQIFNLLYRRLSVGGAFMRGVATECSKDSRSATRPILSSCGSTNGAPEDVLGLEWRVRFRVFTYFRPRFLPQEGGCRRTQYSRNDRSRGNDSRSFWRLVAALLLMMSSMWRTGNPSTSTRRCQASVPDDIQTRPYDLVLKVARTIADLAGAENIASEHISEAIQFRSLDRQLWT